MIPPVDGAAAEVVSSCGCGLLLAEASARVSDIIIAVVVYRSMAIGLSRSRRGLAAPLGLSEESVVDP